MKKNSNQSRTRLQSLDAAQLARVSGGGFSTRLPIMGGCFPTEPYPEPGPLPYPEPYPIPVW
jgi:hypothetical protein